jgi:hypothetical protein
MLIFPFAFSISRHRIEPEREPAMPPPLSAPVPRRTAREREQRRIRILAMVRAGFSYEAIARDENLSRERVRQIVAQSLEEPEGATRLDHARVQIARLEPALRLAARGVADGELRAIDRLLRVLDRLDKYGAVAEAPQPYDENARERLLTKLNQMAERIKRARTEPDAADEPPDDAEDEAEEEKNLENGDSGLEVL